MDEALAELQRWVLVATGSHVPLSEGTFSNRADAQFGQAVIDALWREVGRPWTDAPTATPLAAFRRIQHAMYAPPGRATVVMTPATYRYLRQAAARGWWRALPRRDKRALHRRGIRLAKIAY